MRAAPDARGPKFDKFTMLPILACFFAVIAFPLLTYLSPVDNHALEARPETRFFWPLMALTSVVLIVQNRSRLTLPPHILCLLAYLGFAGLSVVWAFSPDRSLIRYLQQVMIVLSIVPPLLMASRTADVMYGLFLCLIAALILNIFFVFGGSSEIVILNFKVANIGYKGYFGTKNQLGECSSVAFLLALNETLQRGWRRAFGILGIILSLVVIWLSNSKTAFSLAFISPFLAIFFLFVARTTKFSLAIVFLAVPILYGLATLVVHTDLFGRISFALYHDSTLTGRTVIWDFVKLEIAQRPLVGWGYQSFWFVPDSPALTEAVGWVKMMPNAHNGYYDTMLELGYVGFTLQIVFIFASLHAIGRVAQRDWRRALLLLSLTLFFILYNFFESLWVRSFEILWVVFLIGIAETGRCLRPLPGVRGAHSPRRASPSAAPALRRPRTPPSRAELS